MKGLYVHIAFSFVQLLSYKGIRKIDSLMYVRLKCYGDEHQRSTIETINGFLLGPGFE